MNIILYILHILCASAYMCATCVFWGFAVELQLWSFWSHRGNCLETVTPSANIFLCEFKCTLTHVWLFCRTKNPIVTVAELFCNNNSKKNKNAGTWNTRLSPLLETVASPRWTGTLLALFTITDGWAITCSVETGQFVMGLLCSEMNSSSTAGYFWYGTGARSD